LTVWRLSYAVAPVARRSTVRRNRSGYTGQAAVELALITPVLALLLVIGSDFARLFFLSIAVNNAARAGVQYGAQNVNDAVDSSGMEQAAQNDYGSSGLNVTADEFCACPNGSAPPIAQSCSPAPACTPASDMRVYVQVQTTATFKTLLNYPGVPSTTTVTGSAVMRVQ
jgi:Flp pilus assembly protein TadG